MRRLTRVQQADEELKVFQRLQQQEQQKKNADALHAKAAEKLKAGQAREAAGLFREALNLKPDDAELHYDFSGALDSAGDRDGQEQELRKAIKLNTSLPAAHYELASLCMRDRRLEEAEQEFRALLALSPADHYGHYALGRALEKQGKESEANGHFKLASSLRPQNEHYASRILDLDREEPDPPAAVE